MHICRIIIHEKNQWMLKSNSVMDVSTPIARSFCSLSGFLEFGYFINPTASINHDSASVKTGKSVFLQLRGPVCIKET